MGYLVVCHLDILEDAGAALVRVESIERGRSSAPGRPIARWRVHVVLHGGPRLHKEDAREGVVNFVPTWELRIQLYGVQ